MRNLFLRGGFVVALVGVWVCAEKPLGLAEEEATATRPSAGAQKGVLVLKTGQLVEGKLSQNAGGYIVEFPTGSYLVPFERVSVVAEDRHGAYKKLKSTESNPTPDFQVALARWCIGWKLYEEARIELRDALVAEPSHEQARAMYARLHQLMNPEQQSIEKPTPKTRDGFQPADPESLAGLSPEAAKQFVVRVQPLLLNRCGNAGCHGSASGREFQIAHVRRGLNRQTLDNLEAVLRFVNASSPEESPLLTVPAGTHGRNGRPIFYGSTGEQNLETLREWVQQVAADQTGDVKDKPKPNVFAQRSDDEEPDQTLIRGAADQPAPLTPEQQAAQEKEELLQSILRNEQRDAFDPAEFNRKYGSQ